MSSLQMAEMHIDSSISFDSVEPWAAPGRNERTPASQVRTVKPVRAVTKGRLADARNARQITDVIKSEAAEARDYLGKAQLALLDRAIPEPLI